MKNIDELKQNVKLNIVKKVNVHILDSLKIKGNVHIYILNEFNDT